MLEPLFCESMPATAYIDLKRKKPECCRLTTHSWASDWM